MTYYSLHQFHTGLLEVICGPMFSGKTEELIRRARRSQIARQKVQIFKHTLDDRFHNSEVVSHSAISMEATNVSKAEEILDKLEDFTRVVIIDEVQFFDESILTIVDRLLNRGLRVICAGLDLDYMDKPFGPVPKLMAMADEVTKIKAICTICGSPASKTQRIIPSNEQIYVGENEAYEARCRIHYEGADGMQGLQPKLDLKFNPEQNAKNIKNSSNDLAN